MSNRFTDPPKTGAAATENQRALPPGPESAALTPPAEPSEPRRPPRRQRVSLLSLLSRSLLLSLPLVGCANHTPLPKTAATPGAPAAESAAVAAPAAAVEPEVQRVFEQAVALLRQQQYSQVVDTLSPVAAQHPELPGLLVNLAVAYIHLERQEQATAVLQQALHTDPQHPVALNWLAILERRAGRFEEAKALYQQLLAAHPESRHGHLNLGILCDLYLRQADCALKHYRRYQALAAEADPEVDNWIADLERRRQQG